MSPIYFKAGDSIFEGINDQYCPGEDNITISGGFAEVEGAELYENMPQCSDSFFSSGLEDNGRGCCKVEDVTTKCRDYTGNVNYDMGLKIIDPNSNNKYDICLSLPFREKLPDFKNFIKLIIQILIALIITAITATCLEFWLKYGNLSRNFYYESNCERHNVGGDSYYNKNFKASEESEDNKPYYDNEISLIDFMFPKRLTFYPYPLPVGQEKKIGGGKWQSADKDELRSGKTSTNKNLKEDCEVGFPYNLIKMTNNEHFSTFLKIPIKCFSLFFLFSMYLARKPINLIYRKTSDYYQNYIEGKDIRSNIIYFILLWLVFIPLVFIILLGQLIISIFGPIYNIIIQIILNFSSPKKFINLFSRGDDFKNNVEFRDGFNVGSEADIKQITEYYKIINLKTIKDSLIPLFVNYKYMQDEEPEKIPNKKKQEYKKAGYAFCAYIALLILSIVKYITGGDSSNFDPSNLGEEDIPDFETSADNANMDTLKSGGGWLGSIIISSIVIFILLVLFIFGAIFAARAGQNEKGGGVPVATAAGGAAVMVGGSNLTERAKAASMRAKTETFSKMNKIKKKSVDYVNHNPDDIQMKLLNAKRFFWSFPIKMLQIVIFVFYLLICFMLFGGLGNLMASMWLLISKLVYFFYIPLSNFKKFLNIIKQHGNLLTIMLCLNVIVGSGVYLDKAVTSIMSLILSVIVVYKCYMYFNQ